MSIVSLLILLLVAVVHSSLHSNRTELLLELANATALAERFPEVDRLAIEYITCHQSTSTLLNNKEDVLKGSNSSRCELATEVIQVLTMFDSLLGRWEHVRTQLDPVK